MFRQLIIDTGLKVLFEVSPSNRLNALEIGCSYTTNESMSTFLIPHFIKSHTLNGRFVSIEYDEKHISAAKKMLEQKDSRFFEHIQFAHGNSLLVLPTVLEDLQIVDFAFLDGGVHPEVCLKEFELVIDYLSEDGLIIIDDVHPIYLPSSQRLIFGKGTLILPFLVINEYIGWRNSPQERFNDLYLGNEQQPNSVLIDAVSALSEFLLLKKFTFVVVSKGTHNMLVVGKKDLLDVFSSSLKAETKKSIKIKLMLAKMRLEKAFGMLMGLSPDSSIIVY